jgi:hypothetical protein
LERVRSAGSGSTTETTDLSNIFEDLSLSPCGGEILENSRMAADSQSARKAIKSLTPTPSIEKYQEFPFPSEPDRPRCNSEEYASRQGKFKVYRVWV